MDNKNKDQGGFSYTYSAKEQAELKKIRDKYTAPTEEEDKMARLRRLDASVTGTAQIAALVLGVVGTLILGFGMSLIMTELSDMLGFTGDSAVIAGVVLGIFGGVIASIAYPVYNAIVKIKRKRVAPEIIRLSDELLK